MLGGVACTHSPVPAPVDQIQQTGHLTQEMVEKAQSQLGQAIAPPAPLLPTVSPEVIAHGPRNHWRIALTFDACSTKDVSKYDERVTAELVAMKTPATIFLGGSWAKEESGHVRELASNPLFELGNHSYTHPHMALIADEKRLRRELERTQAEIHALTGVTPKLFRPPYGEYNDRLVRVAAQLGLTTVEYDLASGDPDTHATKERLAEWVLRKAQPGSIVVMHINHRRFHTSEALPGIIQGLRAKGYELVTVGRLLSDTHAGDGPVVLLESPVRK